MRCYVVYAYRDLYQLPLAVLDSIPQLCAYICASVRQTKRLLSGDVSHIDGYAVDIVHID